jgi:hypothetical protein
VFGQVINNGMDVVNQIVGQPVYNLDGNVFSNTPLINVTSTTTTVTQDNLIFVNDIIILPLPNTAALFAAGLLGCVARFRATSFLSVRFRLFR